MRRNAAVALGLARASGAVEVLEGLLSGEDDPNFRGMALWALGECRKAASPPP